MTHPVVCLSAVPTFGLETKTCYARSFWRNRAINVLGLAGTPESGFSFQQEQKVQGLTHHFVTVINTVKIMGYLPIISSAMGLAKFYGMATARIHPEGEVDSRAASIFRTSVETLSLGWMFIVPDAIVTRARTNWAHAQIAARATAAASLPA